MMSPPPAAAPLLLPQARWKPKEALPLLRQAVRAARQVKASTNGRHLTDLSFYLGKLAELYEAVGEQAEALEASEESQRV